MTFVVSDSAHSSTGSSDEGITVAAQWDLLRNHEYYRFLDKGLIEAVCAHPQLRVLFPFTSVTILHLSRCTRYPFSLDVPCVVRKGTGQYEVLRTPNMPTGPRIVGVTETAAEAVALIASHLPAGCGPAIDGTAEDLR
ncbi:DUF6193 family natural product biosynthesis protein [Nocardia sp. NPDC059239]|uniref:DUF6193 family natural product biosynthesis protein n=1 Tax=unclassified Nocardia TaxID=2637762 RepID=UPI0036B73187